MLLKRGLIYRDITYDTAIKVAKIESVTRIKAYNHHTSPSPVSYGRCLLSGFWENRLRYNGIALYFFVIFFRNWVRLCAKKKFLLYDR